MTMIVVSATKQEFFVLDSASSKVHLTFLITGFSLIISQQLICFATETYSSTSGRSNWECELDVTSEAVPHTCLPICLDLVPYGTIQWQLQTYYHSRKYKKTRHY